MTIRPLQFSDFQTELVNRGFRPCIMTIRRITVFGFANRIFDRDHDNTPHYSFRICKSNFWTEARPCIMTIRRITVFGFANRIFELCLQCITPWRQFCLCKLDQSAELDPAEIVGKGMPHCWTANRP